MYLSGDVASSSSKNCSCLVSSSISVRMRLCTMVLTCRCLLLMLLGLSWPGLGNVAVKAARLREHFIAAQVTSWNYTGQSAEQFRLPNSDPVFQKIIYKEYEANFKNEKPTNTLSGLLGPTLHAEVGDTLIVHFKNLANKPLSIHPQGIAYNKLSEGSSYSDRTSPVEKQDDAVPSGQTYKYVWKVTAETGPRKADPPCLTYAYYSHVNMVQDFNSGLIGALLICKEGSLNDDGTQKLFDREYVLMFAVFDESKSLQKVTSLMYTINGYINGTLPDVQACTYDRISWHLIGMSSAPEIFSIHFNGQTLEQNHHKVSTVSLVGGASATANMSVSQIGRWLISSLVQKHLQAGMHGYLNIENCGNPDIITRKLSYKEQRMIKNWEFFIAAEEITWDYAPEIPENINRQYKEQHLDNFSNLIGKKYKKAVFRQYKDASFSKRIENTRPKEHGILGPVIRAEVRDTITISFKNMASRPYSIYVHGVTLSKEAEGVVYPSDSKENSTQGKGVQPGETSTYTWTVRDTDEPTTDDAQCVTRLYHSAVDVIRDIASGLIGPLLICKRKALNQKGIQFKADVEQHAVFAVFDENKSWYLEDNIKEYCSNPSAVKRDDSKFYKSNVMHTLNGYVSERKDILGFCQDETVEWHLISVGTQDEIVPVHLSGHTFLSRGRYQDILNLFPMRGESSTVTMDNIGTWLLGSWDSREMSNGMRLRFRDAKCDDYSHEDDVGDISYNVVTFPSEKPKVVPAKEERQKEERATVSETPIEDYYSQENLSTEMGLQTEEDYDYQKRIAEILGLRTFSGSVAEEEEQNLTALAIQDTGTYNSSSVSLDYVTVNSDLVFTNTSDTLHGVKASTFNATSHPIVLESLHPNLTSLAEDTLFSDNATAVSTLSSQQNLSDQKRNVTVLLDNYSQPLEAKSVRAPREVQSKDVAELSVNEEYSAKPTSAVPHADQEYSAKPTSAVPHADEEYSAKPTSAVPHADEEYSAKPTSAVPHADEEYSAKPTSAVPHADEEYSAKPTSVVHYTEKEQEENAGGEDTLDGQSEKRVLTEAMWHALKEMRALLFHIQQKRNLSAVGNTTSDLSFLAIPSSAENISSLDSLENDHFSDYYDEIEQETNPEFSTLLMNLTLAVREKAENNGSELHDASETEVPNVQQYGNLSFTGLLDHFVSTLIPKTERKNQKVSHHKSRECPFKKRPYEWNVVSEKEGYDSGVDLILAVDNKLQNHSRNATMYLENSTFPGKRKEEMYEDGSQLELGQSGMNNKYNILNDKINENCTIGVSGTFLKVRRKKKTLGVLTPRSHRPLVSPRGFNPAHASIKVNHTMLSNETNYTLTQNQDKPFVTIGFPNEEGDYHEYDVEDIDSEQSFSGSYEYRAVHYDNPYTTDSRLDISTLRNPDDIAGRYLRTLNKGNIRRYYIAAVEVLWDYTALQKSSPSSTLYKKVIFQSYQDETFRTPEAKGEYEEHFGILGPVIRAEVDDVIQVYFKNLASRPYSLHAHGLSYEKSSEGRSYDDQSSEWFKMDDAIKSNHSYTYVWHATKRSGPSQDQRTCRLWSYYSAVNPEKDIQSGLIGPILICQKGMLDIYNRPIDMREFFLLFMVFDEEKSWYFNKHAKKNRADRTSGTQRLHAFPAINGLQYQMQGLWMYKDEKVHWHLLNMGGPKDIHVIHFHGQTFTEQGIEEHQLGIYPLFPGSFHTVEMKPSKAGVWLLDTEVGEYQKAGMQASFTVVDKECKLPMGLASGIIQDSQISASRHTSYWEPQLARLNNAGKYNAWSTAKKEHEHPWIQVDLQRQVVITGIQTQGATQILKSLYTKEYFITYSNDGRNWIAFKGNHTGTQKPFEGNSDAHGIKENCIDPPIVSRYIRVYPTKYYNRPSLRMELLGCETEGCSVPLGMESGAIKNAQITASSYKKNWVRSWDPPLARLDQKGWANAWQPKSNNNHQWLQIDLLQPKKITAIITQGAKFMSTEMYVKTFSIIHSDDGSTWKSYLDDSTSMEKVFIGNINSGSQVKHFFSPPIFSRFIRVIPKTWNQNIALRVELFGCDIS